MAKTVDDYMQDGMHDAQASHGQMWQKQRFKPESTSWQARAYWTGFNNEKWRLDAAVKADQKADSEIQTKHLLAEEKQRADVRADWMPAALLFLKGTDLKGWPTAAAEHARKLSTELAREGGEDAQTPRAKRLNASLDRLVKRWESRAP